ncbi:ribokinase [Altererythrobacter xixiisoli]|uniref:Ribokinase n=1 Tax=Croceibacterium xixiisoli TaxID=1476466 RepID=A0A6I4TY06_9SPHN|nr:PfkB family carbohydrate kinase [Croceibacterium xixiisoli]MXO99941.1 ribokinase [Croceibacterium xixiisoli]
MTNNNRAFVIGSYVAGCIANAARMPERGETILAQSFLLQPGGKGFNLMAGLHRLGAAVDGILPVGDDLWGCIAPALMTQIGLPTSWLMPIPGPSGGAVGLVDGQGENVISVFPGANARLSPDHVASLHGQLTKARIVAAQCEVQPRAIAQAFAMARDAGITTVFNPSPWQGGVCDLLRLADIVIVNWGEARQIAGELGVLWPPDQDTASLPLLAAAAHGLGVEHLIVTQGAGGAICFPAGQDAIHQPAFPTVPVDTIGAGDGFSAGLIAALLDDLPMADALRQAAACGSLVCRGVGVIDYLPDRAEVEALLRVWPG